ncbi:hypothetical protein Tco_0062203 [Tanacetum coccineum]
MVLDSPSYSVYEELASPEQTATGKDMSNPLYGCDGLPKTVRLLFFDSAVHRVPAVSIDAADLDVASTVSAACIMFVPAGSSSSVPADYVSAGHVLVSADRDRIC